MKCETHLNFVFVQVAVKCKERMHELVKEEVESKEEWKSAMERSFRRMDKEVIAWNQGMEIRANCRCEMQTPECDAVGSTAVVAVVTPDKIIVANCGDSRAVLCRNGKPLPLSSDHKVCPSISTFLYYYSMRLSLLFWQLLLLINSLVSTLLVPTA